LYPLLRLRGGRGGYEFFEERSAIERELRRNQTDAERVFWARVRNKQFFGMKFFRQYSFGPYILDFYCPVIKLAVELDGGQHNLIGNTDHDAERTSYLNDRGVQVVRFWNNEVLVNLEGVLERLTYSFSWIRKTS
jgi:very-short-patch-repair endonuclease